MRQAFHKIIENSSYDEYFINSAYLSELWAVQDLKKKLDLNIGAKSLLEDQIADEIRHAQMLRNSLLNVGFSVCDDIRFAMQEVIHFHTALIDPKDVESQPELFWSFHEIMERRAIWNYRTCIVGGIAPAYRAVLKRIIKDEKGHLTGRPLYRDHALVKRWIAADAWVFNHHIKQYYNNLNLLKSHQFWKDYYSDQLVKPASAKIINF